ncbi:Glutamine--fructose-6-phosphate aminotransferase [isomerizing] 1 [Thelohanellus kitauei]|nr:Glutamine--fructose-6-phosphate aminotransferase [isomerizing] 1 [Thelohanellus kitauei]
MMGPFDSFIEKEIFEQPESVLNTMRGRVDFAKKTIKLNILEENRHIAHCRRIVFVACGSSYNSCIAARQQLEKISDIPIMIEHGSDLLERDMPVFRDDCCVFVSRSGETEDTIQALRYCRKFGAVLIAVTNTLDSTITKESDADINLNAKPEIGESTKTYTSQVLILILFACMLGKEKLPKTRMIAEIVEGLNVLSDIVKDCLKLAPQVKKIAKKYMKVKSCLVIGGGPHTATCLEASLKIKKLSLIHTEGLQSGDLKYSHLDLVNENVLVIIVITECRSFSKTINALHQVLGKKAKPVVITDCKSKLGNVDALDVVEIPSIIECLQPIAAIVPLQLLSVYLAKCRGVPLPNDIVKFTRTPEIRDDR